MLIPWGPALCGLVLGAGLCWAQNEAGTPVEDGGFIITAESNLVVVPLHVYRKKRSVNGLPKEAFELREDGVLQDIAFVEGPPPEGEQSTRDVPTEIIFLIDFSYSVMTPGLLDFTAVRSTMLDRLRDNVLISIYGFAANLKHFTGPTRDVSKLQWALDQAHASEAGGSRVYEAIIQTAKHATDRGGNISRMMVVFSDGFSTTNLDPQVVVRAARAFGIPLYPVVLGHDRVVRRARRGPGVNVLGPSRNPVPALNRGSNSREQENRMRIFADIGPQTGGRSYDLEVINSKVIRHILGSLSELAETEYVVGYYPKAVDEALTPHEVQVSLTSQEHGRLYGGRRFVVH